MIFTPTEIQELGSIIERTHVIFIGTELGKDVLSPKDIQLLIDHGIDISKLPEIGKIDVAFRFGLLADSLGKKRAGELNYKQIKDFIASGKFVPLSEQEKFAVKTLKFQSYSDIKKLEGRVVDDINKITISASKKKLVGKVARDTIRNSRTVSQMSSELSEKTGDWARDFDRISDYVLHDAFDTGKAHSVQRQYGDDALVYKEVYPGACKHCQKLYLTNGIGSKPKVFKLLDLISNGSNIGRKTNEWLPCIGPTHPYCRCELENIPPNYHWNEETGSFQPKRVETKRKSRAKITITEHE